jgi:hypothetical protein
VLVNLVDQLLIDVRQLRVESVDFWV